MNDDTLLARVLRRYLEFSVPDDGYVGYIFQDHLTLDGSVFVTHEEAAAINRILA